MKKTIAIVVTYNGMKWINDCLLSIKNSTIEVEIVVVDNNSSDNTLDFVMKNFPSVVLFPQNENLGFGKANNIGMRYALEQNADYVFLLNQDAKVEKDTIEKLIELAENHPEFGILSPIHLNWEASSIEFGFYHSTLFSDLILSKNLQNYYIEDRFINASCWLLPIKTLKTVGGFDPIFFHYGEDVNYCQRVIYHKLKMVVVPTTKVFHDTTNSSDNKKQQNSSKEVVNYFKNKILVKYANINTSDSLSLPVFKNKLFLSFLFSIVSCNKSKINIAFQKWKIIKKKAIFESVKTNKIVHATYLTS